MSEWNPKNWMPENVPSGQTPAVRRGKAVRFVLIMISSAAIMFLAVYCPLRARSGPLPPRPVYMNCEANGITAADCSSFNLSGKRPRNVILMIGDGMGQNQIYAARVYLNGPDRLLALERPKAAGTVSTCSLDDITDSAASATAMSTGHKTLNGAVSVEAMPVYKRLENLSERVDGKKAMGVVSTASMWDGTPAAFVSHAPLRDQTRRIACEMILDTRPEVILGGGASVFQDDSSCPGRAFSGSLVVAAEGEGYQFADDQAGLLKAIPRGRALGLFTPEEMTYMVDRREDNPEPLLSEMADFAIETLSSDPRGFFLMVEGGRIDHACHEVDLVKMIGEMKEFDRTVKQTIDWARRRGDTLVIVTADHETGGMEIAPADYRKGDLVRVTWTREDMPGHASHSSQRVMIYGFGPGSELIRPEMDNTQIRCLLDQALGIGEGLVSQPVILP